jgi:hypothetical protein
MTASRRSKWWVVVPLVLLLPVIVTGLYFARGGGAGGHRAAAVAWTPGAVNWVQNLGDDLTEREPHTSMATLERYVAESVSATVAQVGLDTSVKVVGDGPAAPVAHAIRQRLNPRLGEPVPVEPSAATTVERDELRITAAPAPALSPPPQPEREETLVTLSWRDLQDTQVPWWPATVRTGELIARVEGPRGDATITAKLDEKPWLSTPPGAVGRAYYAVVTADAPAASSEEAREVTRRLTVDTLAARLGVRVASMNGRAEVPQGEVRRQAEYAVVGGGAVLDQCVVRVRRTYGDVWYAANLVDAHSDRLDRLARVVVDQQDARKWTFAGALVALPGMMLVLGVVYLGLNAVTRGYFRTHLRAAVVAAVAVAVVAFLLVMG